MPPLHSPLILLLVFCLTPFVSASLLPHQVRATSTSDLIGLYTLHPEADIAARARSCPKNLTTETFEFQVTRAPFSLAAPKLFNIQIDHRNTLVDDSRCESTGTIVATTSSHPFAAGNKTDIINTWSAAGRSRPARWISQDFIQLIASQSFAVGYDFVGRSCRGKRVKPGVGFLWFQPTEDVQLGVEGSLRVTISVRNKYLLLTFANDPFSGCVFVADTLGGEGDFSPGPVSDPSLEEEEEPDTISGGDKDTPETPTSDPDDTTTEPDEDPTPEPDELEDSDTVAMETPDGEPDDDDPVDSDQGGDDPVDDQPTSDDDSEDGGADDVNSIFSSDGSDDPAEEPACFPASALVELEDGRVVQMAHLDVGHKVRISGSRYSDVFFFSHRQIQKGTLHNFIKITITDSRQIILSPGHYLYADDGLIPARSVRVGAKLYAANGHELTVRNVENVKEEGLLAPHTLHGDIVINGIRASTYTAAVHPHLAHYVLLVPVRALYHLGVPHMLNGILDSGLDRLRRIIPRGPEVMREFL